MDRQATTVISPDEERGFGFGQPTEMLGSNPLSAMGSSFYMDLPSSVRPLSQGSPLIKYGTKSQLSVGGSMVFEEERQQLSPQQDQPPRRSARPNKSRKLTNQSTPSRKDSCATLSSQAQSAYGDNNNADYRDVRIPSSESPSPMKPPPLQRNSSISPAKLDPGAAKALHESIASLLGKRHSPEDDELPNVESVEETPATKGGGSGRRSKRPLRAKVRYSKPG